MRWRVGVAIDMGTVNTRVCAAGRGLLVDEPSAVAVDYGCAYTLAHRLGQTDLAETITARQEWAATRTWTPIAKAAADWNRATSP